ncbi:hypothetical protein BVRB_7g168310 isoform B [Beta vulgaris subsp. vulgaris]|uniref:Uncharacterized protein n=1 Tax=Beta vulgaris subsp. vulgaris TaxID=3555 RepID=A0A0J8BZW9_BETVV|nr:hypothetical protein BVRB_7g168310 isoform B [Beta vulgaris subsp. vulgaris]
MKLKLVLFTPYINPSLAPKGTPSYLVFIHQFYVRTIIYFR